MWSGINEFMAYMTENELNLDYVKMVSIVIYYYTLKLVIGDWHL